MKQCSICKDVKDLGEFGKDKSGKFGVKHRCKLCDKDFMRKVRKTAANKRRRKDYDLRTKYDITIEDYEAMSTAQGHTCAICAMPEPIKRNPLAVDHCHETGRVRGLLCSNCNMGIGKFKESRDLLERAVSYLG